MLVFLSQPGIHLQPLYSLFIVTVTQEIRFNLILWRITILLLVEGRVVLHNSDRRARSLKSWAVPEAGKPWPCARYSCLSVSQVSLDRGVPVCYELSSAAFTLQCQR